MTKAYITTFNHKSLDGVAEIAELLNAEFTRSGFDSNICRTLPKQFDNDDLLIVIDEFSEPLIVEALLNFKSKHPRVKMICVLTEFFSPRSWARPPSLNCFKQPQKSLLIDNALYIFCSVSGHFDLFNQLKMRPPGFFHYVFGLLGFVWLALQKVRRPRTPLARYRIFHERGYLWFRALGLQSIAGIFDYHLTLHRDIISDALALYLKTARDKMDTFLIPPPVIKKSSLINTTLEFGVDFSGSLTAYRKKKLRQVIKLLEKISPSKRFASHMTRGFDDSKIKYLLSYNPPQSATWRYSSPMRIIGAIKRGQIPVVSEKFGDHQAEELALLLCQDTDKAKLQIAMLLFDQHLYLDTAWDRLQNYRAVVDDNNREVIRRLLKPGN